MNDKAAREAEMVAESRVTTFVCGISIYNVRSIASKQDSHFSLDGAKDKKHKKGLRLAHLRVSQPSQPSYTKPEKLNLQSTLLHKLNIVS